ncbi:hypothetical protein MTO96_022677 [Rhipicephalus appendiculatus]
MAANDFTKRKIYYNTPTGTIEEEVLTQPKHRSVVSIRPTVGVPRCRRRAQRSAGSPCRARSGQSAATRGPTPGGPPTGAGSGEVGG